nr:MAG TPA: protein of unknown function (DUF5361) [Caudoviricetes sp.]
MSAQPGSPLAAALDPAATWPVENYLLSSIEYSLRWLCWAETEDGEKGRNLPKPPITPASQPSESRKKDLQGMASTAELDEYLSRPRVEMQAVVHSAPNS